MLHIIHSIYYTKPGIRFTEFQIVFNQKLKQGNLITPVDNRYEFILKIMDNAVKNGYNYLHTVSLVTDNWYDFVDSKYLKPNKEYDILGKESVKENIIINQPMEEIEKIYYNNKDFV